LRNADSSKRNVLIGAMSVFGFLNLISGLVTFFNDLLPDRVISLDHLTTIDSVNLDVVSRSSLVKRVQWKSLITSSLLQVRESIRTSQKQTTNKREKNKSIRWEIWNILSKMNLFFVYIFIFKIIYFSYA